MSFSTPSKRSPWSVLPAPCSGRPSPFRPLGLSPLPPQGASSFFSLVGANRPALRLDQSLDLERWPNMTFRLLARVSRHSRSRPRTRPRPPARRPDRRAGCCRTHRRRPQSPATQPQPPWSWRYSPSTCGPWFLPCSYSDGFVCIHAKYHGAVPTGHRLVRRTPRSRVAGAWGLQGGPEWL